MDTHFLGNWLGEVEISLGLYRSLKSTSSKSILFAQSCASALVFGGTRAGWRCAGGRGWGLCWPQARVLAVSWRRAGEGRSGAGAGEQQCGGICAQWLLQRLKSGWGTVAAAGPQCLSAIRYFITYMEVILNYFIMVS